MSTPMTNSEVSDKRSGFTSALFITPPKLSEKVEDGPNATSKSSGKGTSVSIAEFDIEKFEPMIDLRYK